MDYGQALQLVLASRPALTKTAGNFYQLLGRSPLLDAILSKESSRHLKDLKKKRLIDPMSRMHAGMQPSMNGNMHMKTASVMKEIGGFIRGAVKAPIKSPLWGEIRNQLALGRLNYPMRRRMGLDPFAAAKETVSESVRGLSPTAKRHAKYLAAGAIGIPLAYEGVQDVRAMRKMRKKMKRWGLI